MENVSARIKNRIDYDFLSSVSIDVLGMVGLQALVPGNATLFYFTILKSYFINYTIPCYNTFNILNFYFPILLIKIIYLYNKIIFLQSP